MKSLPKHVFFGGVVLTVSAVYAPIVAGLVRDWIRDPNYSHGFLIPVVSAFLLWRQRKELLQLPRRPSNIGLVGILVAAFLHVLGAAAIEVFTQRMSLILLLLSIVLFLFGWQHTRRVAFPLAFLFFAIPMPYIIYYGLTEPLQAFAAKCAVLGLQSVGISAVAQGNIIHLPETSLEVAEACSGIRSLYSFLALGALLAHSMKVPPAGRVVVFLLTIPVSVVANAFRVWASGVGVHLIGPGAAEGTAHELFGLVVFATALGVFLLVRRGVRIAWQSAL